MSIETKAKLNKIKAVLGNQKELDLLTDEQMKFILHPLDAGSFLKACPGSGKTQCVGIKLAFHVSQWNNRHSGIAVLSFTRNAANEIKKRANLFLGGNDVSTPHFVGTIDSWIHNFIFHPFGHIVTGYNGVDGDFTHRLISNESKADFLNRYAYKKKKGKYFETIDILNYSLGSDHKPIWIGKGDKTFSKCDQQILRNKKKDFVSNGFVTYADIEYWSYCLLSERTDLRKLIAKRFPYIFIDECQDLSRMQLSILDLLINFGVKVHLVGDLDQAIYEFRKVYPEYVLNCINYWNLEPLKLTRNFRSTQSICDFASKLKGREKMKAKNKGSEDDCLLWEYDNKDQLPNIQLSFLKELEKRGIKPENAIIIARGKSTLNQIRGKSFPEKKSIVIDLATALFKWTLPNKTGSDLNDAFKLCSQAILDLVYDGKRNIYQVPENFSPIEWRHLIVKLLDEFKDIAHFQHNGQTVTWSIWVNSYLKPKLQQFWSKFENPSYSFEEARKRIRAADGTANDNVFFGVQESHQNPGIKLETIHGVKGETYDAVLLVSSPSYSQGGYFVQWLKDQNNEYNRFAYVACTRPRHLLIVAIPKSNHESRNLLINMGLKPTPMP